MKKKKKRKCIYNPQLHREREKMDRALCPLTSGQALNYVAKRFVPNPFVAAPHALITIIIPHALSDSHYSPSLYLPFSLFFFVHFFYLKSVMKKRIYCKTPTHFTWNTKYSYNRNKKKPEQTRKKNKTHTFHIYALQSMNVHCLSYRNIHTSIHIY